MGAQWRPWSTEGSQAQMGEGGPRLRGSLRRDRITGWGWDWGGRGGVPQEKSRARAEQGRRSRCEGQAQGQPGREEVISVPGPGPGALGLLSWRPGPDTAAEAGLHLRAQVPGTDVPAHTVLLPPHPVPRTHLPGWGRNGSLPIRVEILVGVWRWAAGKGQGAWAAVSAAGEDRRGRRGPIERRVS